MKIRAFTLIELLVVIAIIAILAAILFPVFAQAKRAAKSSAALSNTKQVILASIQYSNDSDDVTPLNAQYDWDNYPSFGPDWAGYAAILYPYVKSRDLYFDPLQGVDPAALSVPTGFTAQSWAAYFSAIKINSTSFGTWPGWSTRTMTSMEYLTQRISFSIGPNLTIDQANYPSSPYAIMADNMDAQRSACVSFSEAKAGMSGQFPDNLDYNQIYIAGLMHGDKIVSAYGDGHSKSVPSGSLVYNVDTDASGSHGGCEVAHFMQYGYYSNNTPADADLNRLQAWGKFWDGSW